MRPIHVRFVLLSVAVAAVACASTVVRDGDNTSKPRPLNGGGGEGDPCTHFGDVQGDCMMGLWCNSDTGQCQSARIPAQPFLD
jgi:hypothetical protein